MQNIQQISGLQCFFLPPGKPGSIVRNQPQVVKPWENRHTDHFPHDKEHKDIFKLPLSFVDPGYHAMQEEPVEEILDHLNETTLSHSPLRTFLTHTVNDDLILKPIEIKCKIKKYGGSARGEPPIPIY